ncbi:hypothetical protein GE09DRAFT_1188701 [Coniochaeta sp. 2T2.1]|nr:hypothetical protein GE09DRAFT_1188701 [Coniochaeta sp. 2T2.1]
MPGDDNHFADLRTPVGEAEGGDPLAEITAAHKAAIYPIIREILKPKDPHAVLKEYHAKKFFTRVFAGGWTTAPEPPTPAQKKNKGGRRISRMKGQPAYLSVVGVCKFNTLEEKAKDARGVFASGDYIDWPNGDYGLSQEMAARLCAKAEAAFVSSVDSWNVLVAVYLTRKKLQELVGVAREPELDPTPGKHRAITRQARNEQVQGPPADAKRKR